MAQAFNRFLDTNFVVKNLDGSNLELQKENSRGLLKHLPSSWFKEVANFLIDTQKTLEMAQRRNENHANNREKCNIFSSTLGKKILTSNVSAQSKPTSAPRKM